MDPDLALQSVRVRCDQKCHILGLLPLPVLTVLGEMFPGDGS
jgi:hypothetical protein